MATSELETLVGSSALAALQRPIETARGLPARAYTSQDFFDLEQRVLFPNTWVGVCFAEDVAGIGDALPLTVSGRPIVVLRDAGGTIRAFDNVCRHRATIVLQKPATGLTVLQCPYHAWTYGLDGALRAAPFWDGTKGNTKAPLDRAANGLAPIRCEVWNHMVFINLSGTAEPLATTVKPVDDALAALDLGALRLAHRHTWDFQANWKLVFENWENYHHVWVHEGVFDKMSDEVDLVTGESYTEMAPSGGVLLLRRKASAPPRPASAPLAGQSIPAIPLKPGAKGPFGGCTTAVLPNVTATMGVSAFAPAIFTPIAPGVTRASMAWYFPGEAATSDAFKPARERVLERWLGKTGRLEDRVGIRAQDHTCMELQQAARHSPIADDVQFSPVWEENVLHFQRWLVDRLRAG